MHYSYTGKKKNCKQEEYLNQLITYLYLIVYDQIISQIC